MTLYLDGIGFRGAQVPLERIAPTHRAKQSASARSPLTPRTPTPTRCGDFTSESHGSLDEAKQHFQRALATGKERPYVRQMQLFACFRNFDREHLEDEPIRVVNDMRLNSEPLPPGDPNHSIRWSNLWNVYYSCMLNATEQQSFLSAKVVCGLVRVDAKQPDVEMYLSNCLAISKALSARFPTPNAWPSSASHWSDQRLGTRLCEGSLEG